MKLVLEIVVVSIVRVVITFVVGVVGDDSAILWEAVVVTSGR
jgi:hypothetical protein